MQSNPKYNAIQSNFYDYFMPTGKKLPKEVQPAVLSVYVCIILHLDETHDNGQESIYFYSKKPSVVPVTLPEGETAKKGGDTALGQGYFL